MSKFKIGEIAKTISTDPEFHDQEVEVLSVGGNYWAMNEGIPVTVFGYWVKFKGEEWLIEEERLRKILKDPKFEKFMETLLQPELETV